MHICGCFEPQDAADKVCIIMQRCRVQRSWCVHLLGTILCVTHWSRKFCTWKPIDFCELWGYLQLTEVSACNPLLTLWMGSNKILLFNTIDNNCESCSFAIFKWHHFISSLFSTWIGPKAIHDFLLNFTKVNPKLTGKQMHAVMFFSNLCPSLLLFWRIFLCANFHLMSWRIALKYRHAFLNVSCDGVVFRNRCPHTRS